MEAKKTKTAKKRSTFGGFDTAKIKEAALNPLFFVGGLIGGSLAGTLVSEKVLKTTDEDAGIKKFIMPAVQIAGGVLGSVMLKDKNMKLIAHGVTASGVVKSVKILLKKDLIAGFGDAPEMLKLKITPYEPDLPAIEGYDEQVMLPVGSYEDSEFSGLEYAEAGEIPITN